MRKVKMIVLLCCVACLSANAQVLPDVVQKYDAFRKALPASRLHFVVNQDKYSPGDTVYLKAYFFKDDQQLVSGRQLINVDLVAPGGKKFQHIILPVSNGTGANQLALPDTLAPGIYLLTAYSSWMKNFDTPPVFTKEIVVVDEKSIVKKISEADRQVSVAIDQTNRARIDIPATSMLRYQQLYFIITNRNGVTFSKSFTQGVRDVSSFELPSNVLQPGANVLHVVNKLWIPVGGGVHYVPETNQVTAQIDTDGAQLQTRKTGSLSVTIRDENKQPIQGEFSVRILNAALTDSIQATFAHDVAMSTPTKQSWRQIMLGRTARPKFQYTTDLAKTGRVFLQNGSLARSDTRMFFYMHEHDVMIQSMVSAGGRIRLSVPDVLGNDELFYMAQYNGEELKDVSIVWDEATIEVPSPPAFTEINEPDVYGIFAANKKMIDKAFEYNETTTAIVDKPEQLPSELEERLQTPDITIDVDDYVSFATMAEMIKEIIPALNVRTVKGRSVAQMGLQQGIPESEPLYIIDGYATKDTQFFLSFKPIDLKTIKLITNPAKLAPLGLMSKSGIVIVETKHGNARLPVDASKIITGINRTIAFKQTGHSNIRRPDFRSTIFWAPIVKTDAAGKAVVEFQCSDDLGPIKVRVDGTTSDGRPFSGETTLNFVLAENK